MGKIVCQDESSLSDKIVSFMSYRSKDGKPFTEMIRWEKSDYGCCYTSDADYFVLLAGDRKNIKLPKETCRGVYINKISGAKKDLRLKFYSAGRSQNDLVVECYITTSQETKTHIIKEIYSFVSSMVDKNSEHLVQLQRYDLSGKFIHQNKILEKLAFNNAVSDEELWLLNKYFCETSGFPHFHFSSRSYGDKLAINLDNLIGYVNDLINSEDEDVINKYSLGMPFLSLKYSKNYSRDEVVNFIIHLDKKLNDLKIKYTGKIENIMIEEINERIYSLNLADLTSNSIESCLFKLLILKILNEAKEDGTEARAQMINLGNNSIFDETDFDQFIEELDNLQLQIANHITKNLGLEKLKTSKSEQRKDEKTDEDEERRLR